MWSLEVGWIGCMENYRYFKNHTFRKLVSILVNFVTNPNTLWPLKIYILALKIYPLAPKIYPLALKPYHWAPKNLVQWLSFLQVW
jgi:hypothetical protein